MKTESNTKRLIDEARKSARRDRSPSKSNEHKIIDALDLIDARLCALEMPRPDETKDERVRREAYAAAVRCAHGRHRDLCELCGEG